MTEKKTTKRRKRVVYVDHLYLCLALRQVPEQLPRRIYLRAKEQFFDTNTQHRVAVARARYAGKMREMAVSFENGGGVITLNYYSSVERTTKKESNQRPQVDTL